MANSEPPAAASTNGSMNDHGSPGSKSPIVVIRKDTGSVSNVAMVENFVVERRNEDGKGEEAEEKPRESSESYSTKAVAAPDILLSSDMNTVNLKGQMMRENEKSSLWKLKRRIRLKLLEAEAGNSKQMMPDVRHQTRHSNNSGGRKQKPNSNNGLDTDPDEAQHLAPRVTRNGDAHPILGSTLQQQQQKQTDDDDRDEEEDEQQLQPHTRGSKPPHTTRPRVKIERRSVVDLSTSDEEADVSDPLSTFQAGHEEEDEQEVDYQSPQQSSHLHAYGHGSTSANGSERTFLPKFFEPEQRVRIYAVNHKSALQLKRHRGSESHECNRQAESDDFNDRLFDAIPPRYPAMQKRNDNDGSSKQAGPGLPLPSKGKFPLPAHVQDSRPLRPSGRGKGKASLSTSADLLPLPKGRRPRPVAVADDRMVAADKQRRFPGKGRDCTVPQPSDFFTLSKGASSFLPPVVGLDNMDIMIPQKPKRGRPKGSTTKKKVDKAPPEKKSTTGQGRGRGRAVLKYADAAVTQYEQERELNIRRNQAFMESLNLYPVSAKAKTTIKPPISRLPPDPEDEGEFVNDRESEIPLGHTQAGSASGIDLRAAKLKARLQDHGVRHTFEDSELEVEDDGDCLRAGFSAATQKGGSIREKRLQQKGKEKVAVIQKEKAPRGRPLGRKTGTGTSVKAKAAAGEEAQAQAQATQVNQALLKLVVELVKNGNAGSISQKRLMKLERPSGGGESSTGPGTGRGRRGKQLQSPTGKTKLAAKKRPSPNEGHRESTLVEKKSRQPKAQTQVQAHSQPHLSSPSASVPRPYSGRGRKRKETWLTTIPFETPKTEYELSRDEILVKQQNQFSIVGVVAPKVDEQPPARPIRPYHKRWTTAPDPAFSRQTRLKRRQKGELPLEVKQEENVSESEDLEVDPMDFEAKPDPEFGYSTVVKFSDWINSNFPDSNPPSAATPELKWCRDNNTFTAGRSLTKSRSRIVGFQSQMGREQLQDPLLTRIYTMDVNCIDGQKNGLLVAGGTQGRITVFPLPASGSAGCTWRRPGNISLSEDDGHSENLPTPSLVNQPTAPLLSWAVDGSWISQVLFLSAHFQGNEMLLLTTSNDGSVVLWDINQVRIREGARVLDQEGMPRVVCQTKTLHTGCIFGMHELDGKMATAAEDCVGISVIRETMIFMERFIAGHHTGTVRSVKFRDNNILADCGTDMVIGILDLRCPDPCALKIPTAHKTGMSLVEWSPKSDHVLLSASLDPQLYLHDIRSPGLYQQILQGHVHPRRVKCYSVYRPAFVDGGNAVVSPGEGTHQLSLYSVYTGATTSKVHVGYDTTILHWNSKMAEGDGTLWAACTHITKFITKWGQEDEDSDQFHRSQGSSIAEPPPAYLEELM